MCKDVRAILSSVGYLALYRAARYVLGAVDTMTTVRIGYKIGSPVSALLPSHEISPTLRGDRKPKGILGQRVFHWMAQSRTSATTDIRRNDNTGYVFARVRVQVDYEIQAGARRFKGSKEL